MALLYTRPSHSSLRSKLMPTPDKTVFLVGTNVDRLLICGLLFFGLVRYFYWFVLSVIQNKNNFKQIKGRVVRSAKFISHRDITRNF